MSTVVQFCTELLTQRQADAADDDADDDAGDDNDNDVLFLLSTVCQLYLDVGDGKCSRLHQPISSYH